MSDRRTGPGPADNHDVNVDDIVSAVTAVVGETTRSVPLHAPEFNGNEWSYVKECIDTGWVSSAGRFVDRFEKDLASRCGARHAVACVNGTAALHAALLVAGVTTGHEVLVPTLTFIGTANAISYCGARPHFVDVDEGRGAVDPLSLERHLGEIATLSGGVCYNRTTGAPITALVVVHLLGHPADIVSLRRICEQWSLTMVEDAAEALGSYLASGHVGSDSRLAVLSFNGNKIVTSGSGGAILTNDAELARRCKHLTTTARHQHAWAFIHDQVGFNYRLANINAALGCAQLEQLPGFLSRKRALAARYINAFEKVSGVSVLEEPEGTRSNYWLVSIKLGRPDRGHRDRVLTELNRREILARPVWALLHSLPMYSHCPRADLQSASRLEDQIIMLPSSPSLVP